MILVDYQGTWIGQSVVMQTGCLDLCMWLSLRTREHISLKGNFYCTQHVGLGKLGFLAPLCRILSDQCAFYRSRSWSFFKPLAFLIQSLDWLYCFWVLQSGNRMNRIQAWGLGHYEYDFGKLEWCFFWALWCYTKLKQWEMISLGPYGLEAILWSPLLKVTKVW